MKKINIILSATFLLSLSAITQSMDKNSLPPFDEKVRTRPYYSTPQLDRRIMKVKQRLDQDILSPSERLRLSEKLDELYDEMDLYNCNLGASYSRKNRAKPNPDLGGEYFGSRRAISRPVTEEQLEQIIKEQEEENSLK